MNGDVSKRSLLCSPIASSFREPPLSTKRERQLQPARIASVPRAARTAPARSRNVHHRFMLQRPHLVTFKRGVSSNTVLTSCAYNSDYDAPYFDQVFQVIKVLGEGSFGQVVCVKSREDQRMYAVKRVLDPFRSESDRKVKLREVQKHELVPPHSNILEFFKAWEERGRLYIQTELCEQSLAAYTQLWHPVPEPEVWNFFVDISAAVDHLHQHDLLHMDIKPENILMTRDKICKLGDFGRVFDLKDDKKDVAEEGDSKYLAREVLNNAPTKAADIFSVGMTILEIATDMELPSQGESWHSIREGLIPERFFANVSTELRGHIMHMIHQDPKLRPTSKQLLSIFTSTISKRRKHIYVHEVKVKMMDAIYTLCVYALAVMAMLRELWQRFGAALFTPTPQMPRTPIASHRSTIPLPLGEELDWSFSDEEGHHSGGGYGNHSPHHFHHHSHHHQQQHQVHNQGVYRRLSPYYAPVNPCPRFRLNFDEENNSTTSNDSQTDGHLPELREGTPPSALHLPLRRSARCDIGSSSPLTTTTTTTVGPAGDWSNIFNDSSDSDDELFNRRGTMTAPPRLPVRSALRQRSRRPPPRLNLHLLDSPETNGAAEQQPAARTPSPPTPGGRVGATPARRRTRNSVQQRLISHDDSADEL